MRTHASAKRFSTRKKRYARKLTRRLEHSRSYRRVRELGRIWSSTALLHVEKLIAQRGDSAHRQTSGDRRQKRMRHAGAGTMRQNITRTRLRRHLKQSGHPLAVRERNRNGLSSGSTHSLYNATRSATCKVRRCPTIVIWTTAVRFMDSQLNIDVLPTFRRSLSD